MPRPKNYPVLEKEFQALSQSEAACRRYLEALRWPAGVICHYCGNRKVWQRRRQAYKCSQCHREFQVTTGTLFRDSKFGLRKWFQIIWQMVYQANLYSAGGFKQQSSASNSQNTATVWRCQQKLRRLMVPPKGMLNGQIEVSSLTVTSRGGTSHHVAVFVQRRSTRCGELRLAPLRDLSFENLRQAIRAEVSLTATLYGLEWLAGDSLLDEGYHLQQTDAAGLSRVSKVAAEVQSFFRRTHRGAVRQESVVDYLNEFAFRFNARKAAKPGAIFHLLLSRAVQPPETGAIDAASSAAQNPSTD